MICVDDRAGSKDLINYPPLNDPSSTLLTRLDSGDVMFGGFGMARKSGKPENILIGVEVKSLFDLINSLDTKRLQGTQIPAMLSTYDLSYLVYYGVYRPCPKTGVLQVPASRSKSKDGWRAYTIGPRRTVPYGWLESALFAISDRGVVIIHIPFLGDDGLRVVAQWVGCAYRYRQKQPEDHKLFRGFDTTKQLSESEYRRIKSPEVGILPLPMDDPDEFQRAKVAASLPGIGFEKAVAAAQHFRSVREMVNADEDEWKKVPRVGKAIAGAVVRACAKKSGGAEDREGREGQEDRKLGGQEVRRSGGSSQRIRLGRRRV